MTEVFLNQNQERIDTAINNTPVKYAVSSGKDIDTVVHCYYLDTRNVSVSAYVMKNKKSNIVYKYLLKVIIKANTGDKRNDSVSQDNGQIAKMFFNKLSAKYSKQIEKTQLKRNWVNQAFVHKR